MKQIIAILREERIEETRAALEGIGVRGVTFLPVTGRGEQKGKISARELTVTLSRKMRMQLVSTLSGENMPENAAGPAFSPDRTTGPAITPDRTEAVGELPFLPKRMLIIITDDKEVSPVVQAIVNTNQTGRHGDGKIFICPMISSIRIGTGERVLS
jgi:nitrogen regulatory protein PII 2